MVRAIGRRRFLGVAGIAGSVVMTGRPGDERDDEETTADGRALTLDTGGTGGTYFPLGEEFKAIVEAETPHELLVKSTGASVENVGNLARGEADFALIQNDINFFAFHGTGLEAFEDKPIEALRGVATLFPETIHVLVRGDTDAETIGDLAGADVNTGDVGSGTRVNARQILEVAGVEEFTELNTDFSTAANQLADGDVDAAFVVGGPPVGAVADLAATADVAVLEIGDDVREELVGDVEFFAADAIPGGTYDGIDEDVETVSVRAMLTTRDGVDAEIVEEVTAAIFDNADQLTVEAEFIDVETVLDGMSIPLHPGAVAYFDAHEAVELADDGDALDGNERDDENEDGGEETPGDGENE
ncbi:TAXI family TRAP transporter solute-binding subunit, partial [Halovivax sp.]|uniref:TAXI family TRAP transporter solute-binding subunit n=1 Tax=Halovivax sp. TaxID=1935978 RepID=UPI0025C5D747